MTRFQAIAAAVDAYNAAYRAAYEAELARINEEYPQ